jgi:hypothetical protein
LPSGFPCVLFASTRRFRNRFLITPGIYFSFDI